MNAWFKALSLAKKTAVLGVIGASVLTLGVATASNQPNSQPQPTGKTQAQQKTAVKAPVITKNTETQTKVVPYQSSTIDDATLLTGTTQVRTAGVNGIETITYEVTLTDGLETDRTQISDVVTTPPTNEVIAKGTKQPAPTCPNGTYVNSAGNVVCRPYESPAEPAGATAQCRDGSYSFSQSRSGTCSHHGGVARWL